MKRLRSLWRALSRANQLDADMQEEMRFHVEMESERLVREQGLSPREARRQAQVRFGGLEKYKELGRDTRGLRWLDAISLDARLAVRMLLKHRWLTLVGGFAMAVAIAIGAIFFEVMTEALNPALPFQDGERVVAVQYATATPGSPERRVLHDFVAWRDELQSIEQLGAFRTADYNLVTGDAPSEPIKVAEITASGFAVARTPPLAGRYLLPADEREGAEPVVVIGYQAWQKRFSGDPNVVGRTINLGGVLSAVVGIMPNGFMFPIDHQFWIPLRANPLQYERLRGPHLSVFGRLAPNVTMEQAQAELTTIGRRAAEAYPETHAHLRLMVHAYTLEHFGLITPARVWMLRIVQLLVGALSFVVAVNLAILMYARTVTRLGEIAVRTALGASRRRILIQLFIESLALTVGGGAAGLALAQGGLGLVQSFLHANGSIPFWVDLDLSVGTVMYALGLAVLAAVIMGVLPGLKATGRDLTASLHELNGRTGTRLGALWSTLVVAQVAVAVAVLPPAVYLTWQVVRTEFRGPGFAADEFVVSVVALGDEAAAVDSNRVRARQLELASRLEAEPGISAVTFSSTVPGFAGSRLVQFEEGAAPGAGTPDVSTLSVDVGLFDAYGAGLLAGRAFMASDLAPATAVIVNATFAREFLRDAGALGRRFRYTRAATQQAGPEAEPHEWYQIVGVVRDFPSFSPSQFADGEPTVYHPAAPGANHPFVLSARFNGGIPDGIVERFRRIGVEIDPAMQMRRLVPLSSYYNEVRSFWRYMAWGILMVTTSVLLLSAAGIYALMSFTVAQRTREIGIRSALGADPGQLLVSVFGRVTRQLALGVLIGSLASGALSLSADLAGQRAVALLLAVAALMLIVGLLAALGPARRTLRIQAADALRSDA